MNLTLELELQLLNVAKKSVPYEMCGMLVQRSATGEVVFKEVPNTHPDPKNYFRIDARAVAAVSIGGDSVLAFVHSHPNGTSQPSADDVANMNLHNKPYVIVGVQSNDVQVWRPTTVPMLGRAYVHGVQDCYTMVQDYYQRELGITLPDFVRQDRWWENAEGDALYENNFKDAGFVAIEASQMQRHDVLLCYWGNTSHVNHALIYLAGDGKLKSEDTPPCVGARLFLHHPYNGLGTRCILGDARLASCAYVLRHRLLL